MIRLGLGMGVIISIVMAVVVQLMPVSGYFLLWKPNFLLLVAVGWVIFQPSQWGVGFATAVGLLADIIFRSPIGLHILTFSIIAAIPLFLSGWLVYFSLIHRCVFIFLLTILAEILRNMLFSMWEIPSDYSYIPMAALTSALVWPFIDWFLKNVSQKRN